MLECFAATGWLKKYPRRAIYAFEALPGFLRLSGSYAALPTWASTPCMMEAPFRDRWEYPHPGHQCQAKSSVKACLLSSCPRRKPARMGTCVSYSFDIQ